MSGDRPPEIDAVVGALRRVRNGKVGMLESDLVDLAVAEMERAGIPFHREVVLAPGCRIDLAVPTAGDLLVGVEAKRGRPRQSSAAAQVARYARTGKLAGIVFLAERPVDLPEEIDGVVVASVGFHTMLGIAL